MILRFTSISKSFTLKTKRFNIRWEMEGKAEILNLHLFVNRLGFHYSPKLGKQLLCYQDSHFSVLALLCEVCRTHSAVHDPVL